MNRLYTLIGVLLAVCATALGTGSSAASAKAVPEYTFEVIRQFPHDRLAFTQGFTYHDGAFYEGTGQNGRSSVREVRIETGQVIRSVDLSPEYFGEGITLFGPEVLELTWQSHKGFVYDLSDFHLLRAFSYSSEGWGLTTDQKVLFLSDDTPEIHVLDPNTFVEKRRLHVHDGSKPISQLNELEFVEGEIFANVWHSDRIARISPRTGEVVGWIDLTGLLSPVFQTDPEAVLNGIAYDAQRKRLFVTGKLWPTVFEIRIKPKPPSAPARSQPYKVHGDLSYKIAR